MPSYRPPVTRDQLRQLEHYLFALSRYTDTVEFQKDIDSRQQRKILYELGYMQMAVDILKNVLAGTGGEVPIVGWEAKNPDEKHGFIKIYHFSSAALAGQCLNINKSHIGSVCRGDRASAGGWCFKYKSEYEEEEAITFDPHSPTFDLITISNGSNERDATADGNV